MVRADDRLLPVLLVARDDAACHHYVHSSCTSNNTLRHRHIKVLAGFAKIIAAMEILQGLREEAYLALANKARSVVFPPPTTNQPRPLPHPRHELDLTSTPSVPDSSAPLLSKRSGAVDVGVGGLHGYSRTSGSNEFWKTDAQDCYSAYTGATLASCASNRCSKSTGSGWPNASNLPRSFNG